MQEFIIRKGFIALDDSQISGSLSVTNAVTGSIFSGSFVGDGSQLSGIDGFPFTGSAEITGSLTVTGSVSATSFIGDGSQLSGIDGFPFTGSAAISGSLVVDGNIVADSFTGSLQGTATTASYVNLPNVDGFTAYSASVSTSISSVLDATTPITATVNNTNSPYTITNETIVIVDSTNGNVTVNLPDLDSVVGTPNQRPIIIYKNDYSQNVVYVQPNGSELVNGTTQDIIVSLQIGIVYNPTSAGWVTEGNSYQSLAELELFFVSRTETGSLNVATASYVDYTDVGNKPTLVSGSSQITYSGLTGIPSGIVSSSAQISFDGIVDKPTLISGSSQILDFGIFATTGSNQFNGSQVITGSLTVTGQVVAQTLNVQQVTSSIVYSSGSNVFGNSLNNTQQFTGSVAVTGSLSVDGFATFTKSDDSRIFITDSGDSSTLVLRADATNEIYTNTNHDLRIYTNGNQNGQIFLKQSNGFVGIGDPNPNNKLHVTSGTVNIAAKFESTDATGGIALADSTGNVELTTSGTNGFNIQPGGGSTVFRVDADGKVGINTPTPFALLHINGEGDAVRITSTNSGVGGAQIDMLHFSPSPADNDIMSFINMGGYYSGTNSAYFSSIRTVATNVAGRNGELQFWTINNGTLGKRAVIDTNGWLGLGIDSPAAHLSVIDENGGTSMVQVRNYNTLATGNFTGNYMVELRSAYAPGSTGAALLVHTEESSNARPTMQVSSAAGVFATFTNGKVGIGETDPLDKLHITNTAGDAGILLEGPSQTLRIDQNSIRTSTTSPINIFTNNTSGVNSLYIENDGRFGVGTTTPTAGTKLDVWGKIRATDDLILAQTNPRIDYDGGNTGSLRFLATSTGTTTVTLLSNGRFGIGTPSPQRQLVVSTGGVNGIEIDSNQGGVSEIISYNRSTNAYTSMYMIGDEMRYYGNEQNWYATTGSSFLMRLKSNGRLGIGTTDPGAALDVNGNGIFRVGGSATNTGDFTITNDNCSTTVSPWPLGSTPIFFINSENTDNPHIGMNMSVDYADGPKIIGYKSRGTAAANVSVLNGDDILSIQAWPMHTSGPNLYKFGGGMTWYKDDGGGTANTYAPVSLKWVMSNSTTTTVEAMRLSYEGKLTINPSVYPMDNVLTVNGLQIPLKVVGSLTGYVQGAILVSSGTDSTPSARGQGIFYFNEANDITWYNGSLYNSSDRWDICRKTVTSSVDESTAQSTYSLFNLSSSGAAYNATGTWGTISSDQRLKENIVDATSKLNDVLSLKVRNFNYIGKEEKYIGFIAQELEEVFPSLVTTNDMREFDVDGNVIGGLEDTKGVKVGMDFAILVKAIQEQQEQIEILKAEIQTLKQ